MFGYDGLIKASVRLLVGSPSVFIFVLQGRELAVLGAGSRGGNGVLGARLGEPRWTAYDHKHSVVEKEPSRYT